MDEKEFDIDLIMNEKEFDIDLIMAKIDERAKEIQSKVNKIQLKVGELNKTVYKLFGTTISWSDNGLIVINGEYFKYKIINDANLIEHGFCVKELDDSYNLIIDNAYASLQVDIEHGFTLSIEHIIVLYSKKQMKTERIIIEHCDYDDGYIPLTKYNVDKYIKEHTEW